MSAAIRMGRVRGFTLLELIVVISIISVMGIALTERLVKYAEVAEKTSMEYTANTINTALLFEFAEHIIRGRRGDISAMVDANPVMFLAQPPSNYLGEFSDPPANEAQRGNWYYDTAAHELVYLVKRGDNFQADGAGLKRVRYRVTILYDRDAVGRPITGIVGVVIKPVEPYRWF